MEIEKRRNNDFKSYLFCLDRRNLFKFCTESNVRIYALPSVVRWFTTKWYNNDIQIFVQA